MLALLLFCSAGTMIAQTLYLRDGETLEPVPWATVQAKPSGISLLSNERGRIDLSALDELDSLCIRSIGYEVLCLPRTALEGDNPVITLQAVPYSLEQILISATRWEQEKENTAARVATISPRQMALWNPQTAADLLGASGQVYVQKSQLGGGSPMIRGFATNRILLVVDGVRMNSAIFRSGNLQNVIALDPLAVEKTEVLFGPGSVLYGSDAVGGVLSFQTLQPVFQGTGQGWEVGGSVFARTATANWEKTGHADLRLSRPRVALVSSLTFTDYDDQVMGSHGPDEYLRPIYVDRINGIDSLVANDQPRRQVYTGYSQWNALQKIAVKLSPYTRLDYGFHYSRSSDVPRYDRLRRPRGDGLRSAEWTYGPQIWSMHNLTLESKRQQGLYSEIRVNLAFQQFEESRINRDYRDPVRNTATEQVDAFSFNLDLQKEMRGHQRFFYGLEGVENVVHSTGEDFDIDTEISRPAPSRYPDGSRWSSYAAYGNYHVEPSKAWKVEAGLRYNYILLNAGLDTVFYPFPETELHNAFGALTGSLGLLWKPNATWLLRATGGSAFRAPNIDDAGKVFDSEPGSVVIPNPGLGPEYAWNAEAGIAKTFGGRVRAEFSAYSTWLQDALVRRNSTLGGLDSIVYDGELSQVQAIQNAAKARVYGFQAALEAKLGAGLETIARWNYQRGEEELDDGSTQPLRHAAPWFGSAELRWTMHRFRLALIGHYQAEVGAEDMPISELGESYLYALDENGEVYTPSWYRLDLRLVWRPTDVLQVSGGIENFTNRRYQTYTSGVAAAGINGVLALRFQF